MYRREALAVLGTTVGAGCLRLSSRGSSSTSTTAPTAGEATTTALNSGSSSTVSATEPPTTSTESVTTTDTATETQSGTGEGILDNFNDGTFSGWEILDGSRSYIEAVPESKEGEYALYIDDADVSVSIRKEFESPTPITAVSFWFKYRSSNDNNLQFWLNSGGGERITQIREFGRALYYREPPDQVDNKHITNIQANSWYRVNLYGIDFDQNQYNVRIYDAQNTVIGEVNDIDFFNDVSDAGSFDVRDRLGNNNVSDPVWLDNITYTN